MAGRSRDAARDGTSPIEWVVAGISLAIVLASLAFLVFNGALAKSTPPDLVVHLDSVSVASAGYRAQVRVENRGHTTAAQVQLRGELHATGDTAVVEIGEATLSYVPARGTRRAGLYFTHDPRRFRLALRVSGYELP